MQQNTNTHPIRPFTDLLRELSDGAVLDDLSSKLNSLVEAVANEQKQGSLTLTLTIRPAQKSAVAMVVVPDIKVKRPEPEPIGSIMFPTDDFNLQRDNPRQAKMELKAVPEAPTEMRKA